MLAGVDQTLTNTEVKPRQKNHTYPCINQRRKPDKVPPDAPIRRYRYYKQKSTASGPEIEDLDHDHVCENVPRSEDSGMKQIESRITGLVKWVLSQGAYCCKLEGVSDLTGTPATAQVTMRCSYHSTYSFDVNYAIQGRELKEEDDSVILRQIAFGIVQNISKSS